MNSGFECDVGQQNILPRPGFVHFHPCFSAMGGGLGVGGG